MADKEEVLSFSTLPVVKNVNNYDLFEKLLINYSSVHSPVMIFIKAYKLKKHAIGSAFLYLNLT